jgi:hypothetical protein
MQRGASLVKDFSGAGRLQHFRTLVWTIAILSALVLFEAMNYILYGESTMPGRGLRYFAIPPLVLIILLYGGARYIRHVYHLQSKGQALRYLLAALFGFSYPVLVVSDGKLRLSDEEDNLIERIGGPGYILVQPGNVVLLENLMGTLRVLGAGRHFISQLEKVKDVAVLDERSDSIARLVATTKDGIPVEVRDVRFRYRLAVDGIPDRRARRTPTDPYPFSPEMVVAMTYHRDLTAYGVAAWHLVISGLIEEIIVDHIRQKMIDYLTAPSLNGGDPRGEIYDIFRSKPVRERLRERGAELIWIDIGHFGTPERQVAEQRLSTWQAKWIANANVVRAFGEAQRQAYQELGRAEAQAEMLLGIIHALEDVGTQDESRQNLRAVYLARIAHVLENIGRPQIAPPA